MQACFVLYTQDFVIVGCASISTAVISPLSQWTHPVMWNDTVAVSSSIIIDNRQVQHWHSALGKLMQRSFSHAYVRQSHLAGSVVQFILLLHVACLTGRAGA